MSQANYTHLERQQHMSWCLKNDVIIYYDAIDNYTGRIVLIDKGKKYIKQEVFRQPTYKKPLKKKDKKWWVEVMKLYTSKFLEYNSN